MAEGEGFEPPVGLRLHMISSHAHSTGLCQPSICYSIGQPHYTGRLRGVKLMSRGAGERWPSCVLLGCGWLCLGCCWLCLGCGWLCLS